MQLMGERICNVLRRRRRSRKALTAVDTICQSMARQPWQRYFDGWRRTKPSEQHCSRAEQQGDVYADEVVLIADGEGDPNDKRVRIDARKWAAGKLRRRFTATRSKARARGRVTIEVVRFAVSRVRLPANSWTPR